MKQLSVPFSEKLDSSLADLCNGGEFVSSARVPIVVRCAPDAVRDVAVAVSQVGGKVRHELAVIGAVAAWVPLFAISKLTGDDRVRALELEQEFTIA